MFVYPFTCRDMHSRFIVVSVVDIRIILSVTHSHSHFVPSTNTFEINQKLYFHLYLHLLICKGCLGPISTYMSEKRVLQVVVVDACRLWVFPLPPSALCPSIPSFSFIHTAGCPLQVTSKLLHVKCTSRMYHVHPGDDFYTNLFTKWQLFCKIFFSTFF